MTTTTAPTDAAVTEYARGYFEQNEDVERFIFKGVGTSPEGLQCRDASVYVEWKDGSCDTITVTCWIEDGSIYGEW